jgi:4-cresol dehydrogenase (hydroxylating)
MMRRFSKLFQVLTGWDVRQTIKVMTPVYDLMKGVPTEATLASAYWRKTGPLPDQMDPDRDRCGLLWCSPVVPNTGADVTHVTELATSVLLAHGFEPQMSISLATERSVICVISISYDRELDGEDERASHCYRTLTEQLIARGYPPYRLNVGSMNFLSTDEDDYARLLGALKRTLDPKGVLAPGRYEPHSAASPASQTPALVSSVRRG